MCTVRFRSMSTVMGEAQDPYGAVVRGLTIAVV